MGHLFIETLGTNPTYFFAVIITIVISVTLHELAHGWVAIWRGDDTPIRTGHMTLNPIVHMGIFSLILLAIAGIAFGQMPVDRTRLRGRYAEALVAVAGPVMNFLLGLLAAVALGLWYRFGTFNPESSMQNNALTLLRVFTVYNFALGVFNLIPIPPLDGSWIVANFIPPYRRLMSAELVRGITSALIFAMFLGGAQYVFVAAYILAGLIVTTVAGPHGLSV